MHTVQDSRDLLLQAPTGIQYSPLLNLGCFCSGQGAEKEVFGGVRDGRLLSKLKVCLQGYLAHKKQLPPRNLLQHMPRAIWWS